MAQFVERPTSAQVTISPFLSLSSDWGSVLTAQSLVPALDSVPPSLSLPLPHPCSVSQKKNKRLKKYIKYKWQNQRQEHKTAGDVH